VIYRNVKMQFAPPRTSDTCRLCDLNYRTPANPDLYRYLLVGELVVFVDVPQYKLMLFSPRIELRR